MQNRQHIEAEASVCFSGCKERGYQCLSGCGRNQICRDDCISANHACVDSCEARANQLLQ